MRLGVALCALLGVGPSLSAGAEPVRYGLRAEVGAEYDSNPGRIERVAGVPSKPITGSPAGRLVLSGELAAPLGERHLLTASASGAGRGYSRAEAENVAVTEASAGWAVRAGARTSIGLAGHYYDVFQRRGIDARDFRSVAPALRLEQGWGEDGQLSAGVGYRWFTYKPDALYDFTGPSAYAVYRRSWPAPSGGADWELSGGASGELRDFSGRGCTSTQCPGPAGAELRRDQFLSAQVQATRTGDFLLGAGLAFQANLSNSFGEPMVRGLGHVRAAVLLPAALTLSARAELVVARYLDGQPLSVNPITATTDVNLERENRSTVRLELARAFGAHVDAGLRYTLYTNELGASQARYRRQTALFYLAVLAE
jgi:hypothetical protein